MRGAPNLVIVTVALGVLALLGVQLYLAQVSAARSIGVVFANPEESLSVEEVLPDRPAATAGVAAGDVIVTIDGAPVAGIADYDDRAASFVRGRPVELGLRRGERQLEVAVAPGVPVAWGHRVLGVVVVGVCLALAGLASRRRGLQPGLLAVFLLLLAVELALPFNLVGERWLDLALWTVFVLVTGAQIAVELHLASVIPERQPWLRRRPWIVGLYYAIGLGLGGMAAASALVEGATGGSLLWSRAQAESLLTDVGLPVWATAVALLLGRAAMTAESRAGRMQAALVLLGIAPWVLYVYSATLLGLLGRSLPIWLEDAFPLLILCYPVAVFVAIFRYHLFDVDLFVRRSFVYTLLTTALLLVFYSALGAGGLLLSTWVEGDQHSLWLVSASTLLLGLLFRPLRRRVEGLIDRWLFPERGELRQKMVALVAELPSLGTVQGMGAHLVERLREVFAADTALLLLSDPRSGILVTVASEPASPNDTLQLSLLIPADDPGAELLRQIPGPVTVAELAEDAPDLAARLVQRGIELVAPVQRGERLVGIIALGTPAGHRQYGAEETELLGLLAYQVASTFENIRLYESATYESLTGLLRRGAILEVLDKEIDRARRYDRPLTVGFADLDHFKAVNDRYGHLAGDTVLKRIARSLADGVRRTDAVGRWGGEEFLLVFPETDLEGALVVAEKIRGRIESRPVTMDDGTTVDIRISIGLAALGDVDLDTTDEVDRALLGAADASLYRAKAAGRNRVEPNLAVGGAR